MSKTTTNLLPVLKCRVWTELYIELRWSVVEDDLRVRFQSRSAGTTSERHGPEFYEKIGKKGGQRVKELIERAKAQES